MQTYRAVAAEFKARLVFVTTDSEGPAAERISAYFGLKADTPTPTVSAHGRGAERARPHGDHMC